MVSRLWRDQFGRGIWEGCPALPCFSTVPCTDDGCCPCKCWASSKQFLRPSCVFAVRANVGHPAFIFSLCFSVNFQIQRNGLIWCLHRYRSLLPSLKTWVCSQDPYDRTDAHKCHPTFTHMPWHVCSPTHNQSINQWITKHQHLPKLHLNKSAWNHF